MDLQDAASGRPLSLHALLVIARAVRDGRPFRADDAFLMLREIRRVCPVSLPDALSEGRLSALERAADDRTYLDLLARYALAELIARLEPVGGGPWA
ncbi:hypothetical protein [Lichenibacterium dinghuense]|uniref:hypothetical protein n=1 Tax=Lichenibacterium dinghuense TaxID=2895977 RepID=UPI001F2F37EF|nr:hypothetical protein [Lichenibacterium sp. 6Y81]